MDLKEQFIVNTERTRHMLPFVVHHAGGIDETLTWLIESPHAQPDMIEWIEANRKECREIIAGFLGLM